MRAVYRVHSDTAIAGQHRNHGDEGLGAQPHRHAGDHEHGAGAPDRLAGQRPPQVSASTGAIADTSSARSSARARSRSGAAGAGGS